MKDNIDLTGLNIVSELCNKKKTYHVDLCHGVDEDDGEDGDG